MKKTLILALTLMLSASALFAQGFAVKTNALGWLGCGTINAGVDFRFSQHWSLGLHAYANPFVFANDRSARHFTGEFDANFFFCQQFHGSYIGLHGIYTNFNAGLCDWNYNGYLYGGGIHYGYLLPLSTHWGVDFTIGVGYAHADYDLEAREFEVGDHEMFGNRLKDTWGITRLGINFIYSF